MGAWIYYYRYGEKQARGYKTLDDAMQAADHIEGDGQGQVTAVVDADGTSYAGDAIHAYMNQHYPRQPHVHDPTKPENFREWNGEQWHVEVDWTTDC
jgi:hypothetical protein